MEIAYLVPANRIIKDEATSKFSYIDVFANIVIPRDTVITPQFFAVGGRILDVPAGETTIQLRIVHENGTEITTANLNGPVQAGDLDIAAYVGPVPTEIPGKYFFRIIYNGVPLDDDNKYYYVVTREA